MGEAATTGAAVAGAAVAGAAGADVAGAAGAEVAGAAGAGAWVVAAGLQAASRKASTITTEITRETFFNRHSSLKFSNQVGEISKNQISL